MENRGQFFSSTAEKAALWPKAMESRRWSPLQFEVYRNWLLPSGFSATIVGAALSSWNVPSPIDGANRLT